MKNKINEFISEKGVEKLVGALLDYAPKLISALLILIIGWWLIKVINKMIKRFFKMKDHDETLERFVADLINWGLKIVLIVTVVMQLGVASSSLVAMLGAAGLAIGLALQGSLSNFAGGVLILLFKPYKIGDVIEAQGHAGTVKEISIFTTKLTTLSNELVVIPNGKLSNDTIKNFNAEERRRNVLIFSISYDSDIKRAREVLLELVNNNDAVHQDPLPEVMVGALGASSVDLSLRFWSNTADYMKLRFWATEEGKLRLEEHGIKIPFPHLQIVKA